MNTEYDFYTMGQRYGADHLYNLKEMAMQIGKKYGVDAKLEFEAGICSIIPAYTELEEKITQQQVEHATTNFSKK